MTATTITNKEESKNRRIEESKKKASNKNKTGSSNTRQEDDRTNKQIQNKKTRRTKEQTNTKQRTTKSKMKRNPNERQKQRDKNMEIDGVTERMKRDRQTNRDQYRSFFRLLLLFLLLFFLFLLLLLLLCLLCLLFLQTVIPPFLFLCVLVLPLSFVFPLLVAFVHFLFRCCRLPVTTTVQEYCTAEYTLDASAARTYKVLLPELHGATLLVPKA